MSLSVIYKKSVVYPACFLLVAATLFSIIINRNFVSEWLTREAAVELDFAAALLYGLLVCLFCLPMFLNYYEKISSHKILSALSWFLIPGSFICLVVAKALNEYFTVGSVYEILYAIIFNLPFIIGLIWGFRKFRRLQST
jgi:hypothetical protein